MIVGGEMTCPRCLQQDSTLRVRFIVDSVYDRLTPNEIAEYEALRGNPDIRDLAKPPGEASWEALAEKLRLSDPPRVERENESFRFSWYPTAFGNSLRASDKATFILLWGISLASCLLGVSLSRYSVLACAFFGLPIVAAFGLTWYADQRRSNSEQQLERWGETEARWGQMWYCARDNIVFIPRRHDFVSPDQIKQLLAQVR